MDKIYGLTDEEFSLIMAGAILEKGPRIVDDGFESFCKWQSAFISKVRLVSQQKNALETLLKLVRELTPDLKPAIIEKILTDKPLN